MPPKTTFTKEDIIKQAIEVIRTDGPGSLSARKIAQKLGSSTAPVYFSFTSMDEVMDYAMREIKEIALQYMHKPYTDRYFLNIGMGFAIFARDEKELFRALHLENKKHRHLLDELFSTLREDMLKDPRFTKMPDEDRLALLDKMWRFTLGLATQICFDLIENPTNKFIEETLSETGKIIIADALQKMPGR